MLWRRTHSQAKVVDAPSARSPLVPVTFDELYEAHVGFLHRNARRLGVAGDAVDDVLQQVFLVVHRRLPEVTLTGSERAWTFGILLRVVRDYKRLLRRKSPHRFGGGPTDPESLPDEHARQPDESFARGEAAVLVQRWLQRLTDEQREVFILAELEQMTAREIGEATGTNPSTVASRLRAARQTFEESAERHRRVEGRRT